MKAERGRFRLWPGPFQKETAAEADQHHPIKGAPTEAIDRSLFKKLPKYTANIICCQNLPLPNDLQQAGPNQKLKNVADIAAGLFKVRTGLSEVKVGPVQTFRWVS